MVVRPLYVNYPSMLTETVLYTSMLWVSTGQVWGRLSGQFFSPSSQVVSHSVSGEWWWIGQCSILLGAPRASDQLLQQVIYEYMHPWQLPEQRYCPAVQAGPRCWSWLWFHGRPLPFAQCCHLSCPYMRTLLVTSRRSNKKDAITLNIYEFEYIKLLHQSIPWHRLSGIDLSSVSLGFQHSGRMPGRN